MSRAKKVVYRNGRFEIVDDEQPIAFYTDDKGRRRPIIQRDKGRVIEPTSIRQAALMILDGEIDYTSAPPELINIFNSLNKKHFKNALPDVPIILVHLPKVRHKAFTIRQPKMIVINTAKTRSLKEQIEVLKHEMIHLSGVKDHGVLFHLIASRIGAPIGETEDGQPVYRRMEVHKMPVDVLMINGKPAAKVIAYEKTRGGGFPIVKPRRPITSIDQIPKKAMKVEIVLIGRNGWEIPWTSKWISRDELVKYHLVG